MSEKGVHLDRETFSCSICLDLLKDPVAIPCGHSYCMTCINTHWDEEDQKGIHSCPQCRKSFRPRPVLEKNTMLAALVEELKKTGLQAAPADHHYAGPEDVACDFCTGRKRKAVKSCLVCLVSYCENHLQPHYDVPQLKKHQLVEPSKNLQENICSHHDKIMEVFCVTDQQLICFLCSLDEHKGHESVSAAAERKKKQKEVEESRLKIQQRIQDRQKDVKLLQQELEDIRVSAGKTVEDSKEMFIQMILLLQNRSSEVEQQIRSQQETEEGRVKDVQEKLEQEIRDLEKKDAELKQLSDLEDLSQFLHNYPSVSELSESKPSSSINIRPLRHFEDVTADVKDLRGKLEDILKDTWTNISLTITHPDVLLLEPELEVELESESESESELELEFEPEPKTRAGFLKYSQKITLDPNTAHRKLLLSNGNRKVTSVNQQQSYPDHPDRFTGWFQVLSRESLTGRRYWEVKWKDGADVAVSYKDISRTGRKNECGFGYNDKSWSLYCNADGYSFWHDGTETGSSFRPSSRIGVYLDHSAGILSFYSVTNSMKLLHRVQTTFTGPLHAGVNVLNYGNTAEFIKPK